MYYQLKKYLSCCDVDGHLIFLDIDQNRYFRLIGHLGDAMRSFMAHGDVNSALLEDLTSAQILVAAQGTETHATAVSIQRASRSAIEQAPAIENPRLHATVVLEVMAIVWSTRRQLKTHTLKTILDEASAYRDRKTGAYEVATLTAPEDDLLQANRQFTRARRYVPIEPICLLDSLSLLRFLSRRGLPANIVFGVTPEPFAAHCWVQAGDMALNETLSDANAYAPIRKI